MSIEVEIKARVDDRASLLAALANCGSGEQSSYGDTYYDTADGVLISAGRELRLRTIRAVGSDRAILTYKEPKLDSASQPEYESDVGDPAAVEEILSRLGYLRTLSFEKHCINYRFHHDGEAITATVVRVPELGDQTFVEVEAIVERTDQVAAAKAAVLAVVHDRLGLPAHAVTDEMYTEAVKLHRR